MIRKAKISDDGLYRYELKREWGSGERVLWIMLNPSTADGKQDDPTIRRCIGFSSDWGMGSLVVVNLFAFRATDCRQLNYTQHDPIGPANKKYIIKHMATDDLVVVAWGGSLTKIHHRRLNIEKLADQLGKPLWCLGTTAKGYPRHPLYLSLGTELEPYPK